MNRVRMLVVGTGTWGREHCLSIKKIPSAELVGAVGRNLDKALVMGAEMGVKAFTSITEAIKVARPDAITIVLPHSAHFQATVEAMEQGVHAYVEKSFGASLKDAQGMAEAARERGVKLMAGFSQRYISSYFELARLARSGGLGRIRYVSAKRQSPQGFTEGHWTADPSIAGGGALAGWGTHDVDLAMHIAGSEPRVVYAQMEFDGKGRETQSHILVKHDSGTISEIGIEYFAFGTECFALALGEKGRADAERRGRLTVKREGLPPETKEFPRREGAYFLTDALKAFVDCLLNNSEPPIPAGDGVRVWKVADAAYSSARTGNSVRIS